MNIYDQLLQDEGEVLHAYQDNLGYWTIGIGHLIDKRKGGGISKKISRLIFQDDVEEKEAQLRLNLPWYDTLNEARRGVLLNMCFQMGVHGVLSFPHALACAQAGDWEGAAAGLLDSMWAKEQTPERAKRLSEQMRTGEWR